MHCFRCGADLSGVEGIFKDTAKLEMVDSICRRCKLEFIRGRSSASKCGFGGQNDGCEKDAVYGTTELERYRPNNETTTESARKMDEYLICEEHWNQINK
jgi:hypothetical protein